MELNNQVDKTTPWWSFNSWNSSPDILIFNLLRCNKALGIKTRNIFGKNERLQNSCNTRKSSKLQTSDTGKICQFHIRVFQDFLCNSFLCVFLYINNQDLREIICWKPLFRFWTIYKFLEISYSKVDFKVLPKKGNHSPLNLVFQIKIWRQLPVGGVNVINASSILSWRSVKVLRPQPV